MVCNDRVVALVGKVGSGKTFLLNKLTGMRLPSNAGARSCTKTLQFGYTKREELLVIDTPGFYSSDNLAGHIAAQKAALEGHPLSGVYIVVKYGRADDAAETAGKIMGFVGANVRIIVTHSDIAANEPKFDPDETRARLSALLGVHYSNITLVGKYTETNVIEQFICHTLHRPQTLTISDEQIAAASSLPVCVFRFNQKIDLVYAKIASASKACNDIIKQHGQRYEVDTMITFIQKYTSDMVQQSKIAIFRDADDLPVNAQEVIYGKAGLGLTVRLKSFVHATNALLSWDVSNPSDPRNMYKQCPHCDAVFIKTEGCDGETVCGNVPKPHDFKRRPDLEVTFVKEGSGWRVQYLWNGTPVNICSAFRQIRGLGSVAKAHHQTRVKKPRSVFESGCGANIAWSEMRPLDASKLTDLGFVELQNPNPTEQKARRTFGANFSKSEEKNLARFRSFLGSGNYE